MGTHIVSTTLTRSFQRFDKLDDLLAFAKFDRTVFLDSLEQFTRAAKGEQKDTFGRTQFPPSNYAHVRTDNMGRQ